MIKRVLDAGALVALEGNDRQLWAMLKLAATSNEPVLVPSTALAQVWRASFTQARLSQALRRCRVAPFDELAKPVGALCGLTATKDICDAHVALIAASADLLYTSDPEDLARLIAAMPGKKPRIIRC